MLLNANRNSAKVSNSVMKGEKRKEIDDKYLGKTNMWLRPPESLK